MVALEALFSAISGSGERSLQPKGHLLLLIFLGVV